MEELPNRWLWRTLGFLIGLIAAVAAEFLLFWIMGEISGRSVYPRGLGWLSFPIFAGIAGAGFVVERPHALARLIGQSREQRLVIAATLSWFALVVGYVLVTDPFDGYMSGSDWAKVLKWMAVPPLVACAAWLLFRWAREKEPA